MDMMWSSMPEQQIATSTTPQNTGPRQRRRCSISRPRGHCRPERVSSLEKPIVSDVSSRVMNSTRPERNSSLRRSDVSIFDRISLFA